MKTLLMGSLVALALSSQVYAGPKCTDGDQTNWTPADQMQQQIKDDGYKIKRFKVSKGGCYEIYGWNNEGRKAEVYFNPVTGDVVKAEIDD